jgi:hypothetical protein
MFKRFLFLFILFINNLFFSQEVLTFEIFWKQHRNTKFDINTRPIFFDSSSFVGNKLFYERFFNSNVKELVYTLKEIQFIEANEYDLSYINYFNLELNDTLTPIIKTVYDRGKSKIALSVFPFIKRDNKVFKLISGKLVSNVKSLMQSKKRGESNVFAANSILSEGYGNTFKYKVYTDGFYRIDYNELKRLGIDVDNLSLDSYHIHGNSFGRLPESNSDYRPDDLVECAIDIVGGIDGKFNEEDYIVFFGFGPNKWELKDSIFKRNLNIYSDFSCYYLRIDSKTTSKRISEVNYLNFNYSTDVTSYNYFDVHELEDTSLVSAGQRWYGEMYDNPLTHNFTFTLPSQPVSPLNFEFSVAYNSRLGGSQYQVSYLGSNLYDLTLPTVGTDYSRSLFKFSLNSTSKINTLVTNLKRNSPSTIVFLDKIELNTRCQLEYMTKRMSFRNISVIKPNDYARYVLNLATSDMGIYDITDKTNIKKVRSDFDNGKLTFIYPTDSLSEFTTFRKSDLLVPTFIKKVEPQNLHGISYADYIIVTPTLFLDQAQRLANLHRRDNVVVEVVTDEQVYNEFSSGIVDPTAIKWFAKMLYDRNKVGSSHPLTSLLLFGDGTFDPKDRVANNNYFLPTYQFLDSEDFLSAMVSDDYFGMMDDNESISNIDLLDIGVGRMLISSVEQAKQQVDKIEKYLNTGLLSDSIDCCGSLSESSFGDWRTRVVQIVDDEEDGYFINKDAEPQSMKIAQNHPEINVVKLYSDAFNQEVQAGGQRYPDLQNRLTKEVMQGALIVNYIGHGGPSGAAEERFITIPQINSWNNASKLPLFVSSTCEFTKYDDPAIISAGEWMVLNPSGGAIALMTTTRPVFFGVNTETGSYFFQQVFQRDSEYKPLNFGEILRRTKNLASASSNKRSFTLIGDPGLRLSFPRYRIVIDSLNGATLLGAKDTIKALSKNRISGHIEDFSGIKTFKNGVVYPTIFDKSRTVTTLGQDPTSPVIPFKTQENILFKGRTSLTNGNFSFEFITPKDIDYSFGKSKVSMYGNQVNSDAIGYTDSIIIGGISSVGLLDSVGPVVNMYLNSEKFVEQGLTDSNPKLIVKLKDDSGINTTGSGVGHDILLVVDNKSSEPIVLNSYYQADLNSYQKGSIVYDFNDLSDGEHHLKLKVWDVNNNPSDKELLFTVRNLSSATLGRVYNYPNPFTTSTQFFFEYNVNCVSLDVKVEIFTISGKLIKTLFKKTNQLGVVSDGISWDGLDEFGEKLARGVYVYRLTTRESSGVLSEKLEKLVLF